MDNIALKSSQRYSNDYNNKYELILSKNFDIYYYYYYNH